MVTFFYFKEGTQDCSFTDYIFGLN